MKISRIAFATGAMLLCAVSPAQDDKPAQAARYDGHALIRAHLTSQPQLDLLIQLGAKPWDCVTGVGDMHFSLSPESLAAARAAGIQCDILSDDVQAMIDAERARLLGQPKNAGEVNGEGDDGGIAGIGGANWFTDYKTYPQVNSYIDDLVALRPDLISKLDLGLTHEGRMIHGMRITSPVPPANGAAAKPAVIFNGCQHAREWIAVMVPMYVADALVRSYDRDPVIQSLVDRVEFFIVPIVNPDGYEYTYAIDGDRLWRKNRRDNGNDIFGVDLNRNWSVDWGGTNSTSTDPKSDVYVGPGPFSEPESQALRDFIAARPQIVGHVDFHSFGQYILESWSHTQMESPAFDLGDCIGTDMNEAIFPVHNNDYSNGSGGWLLYLADGTFPDWCYGTQGIIACTVELRDTGDDGFILPPAQIIPNGEEALPAVLRLAERATRGAEFFFHRGLPMVVPAGTPTTVNVRIMNIRGEPFEKGSATIFTRIGGSGPFTQSAMQPIDAERFIATLPPAACGETIEFYFAVGTESGLVFTDPADAPASVHVAKAVEPAVVYNFQTQAGWSVDNSGATSGNWQRGVPVNDLNWPFDPATDADGSGQCFVTQNQAGNTDVDNGSVRLISPALDLSAANVAVSYAYFLHIVTPGGNDPMVVELGDNALPDGGPWHEVARHDRSTSTQWRRHSIPDDELAAAAALTSSMRLRFTVTDGSPQSFVEAGVDDVRISIECVPCIADIQPQPDGDGEVDIDDLFFLLAEWGVTTGSPADIAGEPGGGSDGVVNIDDLFAILAMWGPCP